ncbi:MAG: signal peptidase I [Planctomycetes bacterium]|jgi:signal peptidase I|nr:signal peptidase I [Planctomycetota bacterium]MCL4731049.1 signal peptidase I [Planctomycetota bacterium]
MTGADPKPAFAPDSPTDHRRSWARVAVGMAPSLVALALWWGGTAAGVLPDIRGLFPVFVVWVFASAMVPLAYIRKIYCLLIVLGLLVPITAAVLAMNFRTARVEGPSMLPVLVEGDVLLVDERADLVPLGIYVLEVEGENNPLVKRLVGLPGQTMDARYGRLFADDTEVHPRRGDAPDTWNTDRPVPSIFTSRLPRRLEDGQYFFLGDNPPVSRDSRQFGPVGREAIRGRVVWSLRGSHGFGPVE